jgi:hypothetical protein
MSETIGTYNCNIGGERLRPDDKAGGGTHSPATPPHHLHGSRRSKWILACVPWILSRWRREPQDLWALEAPGEDAKVGEDRGRWYAATKDEERGRGKDGKKAKG